MFCNDGSFLDLDGVYTHQMIIQSNGKPICSVLRESNARLDSDIFELNPLVVGFKYAPKDSSGNFIVYTSNGVLAKDPKKIGVNRLVKHILNPIDFISTKNKKGED